MKTSVNQKHVETKVLAALQLHIGAKNGAHINALVSEVFQQPYRSGLARQIRTAIQALRNDGHHICGTPKLGYYVAATPEELESTCMFLQKRAVSTLTPVRAMRARPLLELAGQARLPS